MTKTKGKETKERREQEARGERKDHQALKVTSNGTSVFCSKERW